MNVTCYGRPPYLSGSDGYIFRLATYLESIPETSGAVNLRARLGLKYALCALPTWVIMALTQLFIKYSYGVLLLGTLTPERPICLGFDGGGAVFLLLVLCRPTKSAHS